MRRSPAVCLLAVALALAVAGPAAADHTDPTAPLAATTGPPAEGIPGGEGTWEHLVNFPPNPGSDLDFFEKDGVTYASVGTLGQAQEQHVGQRLLSLVGAEGTVDPQWIADHGSSVCTPGTGVTGLQHDVQVTPNAIAPGFTHTGDPELLIDTTDAAARCHDTVTGGLEIVSLDGLGEEGFEPREIVLTRHDGTSHTTTVDATRPHIVYTNPAAFTGTGVNGPYIEFVDVSSCLGLEGQSLEAKRAACRPEAYRIPFDPAWSSDSNEAEPTTETAANCHDITATPGRLYCAGLAATLIFDVSGITDAEGNVLGDPLACEEATGTATAAMVVDCRYGSHQAWVDEGMPSAQGWEFLGSVRHVGRDCDGMGTPDCNSNNVVPSTDEIAVSHEADPTADGQIMFATDERGGGVVPGGATCAAGIDNPYGNGGVHAYDISDPSNITHMLTPEGEPATYIADVTTVAPTFCTSHVMELIPGEQRFVIAWYTQGVRIVDYEVDENGALTFTEVASLVIPNADTWVAEAFRSTDNEDGTRTYHILTNDIARGQDVLTWPGPPAPLPQIPVDRIGGPTPVETAVAVAREGFDAATTVVIGRDDVYADSLAGGPLAASLDAPLLYSDSAALSPATQAEIERLGATRALLLGGTAALSQAVEDSLVRAGLQVERFAGANRFDTAAQIAAELGTATGSVFVAEGEHEDPARGWPDPVAAAPYAGFRGDPILLVNRDRLPEETSAALAALGATEAIVVGGTAAVSEEVAGQLGVESRRLAGATRYETAEAIVAEAIERGMRASTLWLATGTDWPDALAAGPLVASRGELLGTIDGAGGADTKDALIGDALAGGLLRRVVLVGDEAAITPAVAAEVEALVNPAAAEGDARTARDDASASVASTTAGTPSRPDTVLLLAGLGVLVLAATQRRRAARAPLPA